MADPWDVFNKPPQQQSPENPLKKLVAAAKKLKIENTPVFKAMQQFAQLPAEGINAVLGAPQRITAERIANFGKNPAGVAATSAGPIAGLGLLAPPARQEIGNEFYAAFHPNDPEMQQRAMAATGANRLMTDDPRFRGKLRNFAVQMGFQTLTDPLTFATAGTGAAGDIALRGIGRAGTAALRSSNEAVRGTAANLLTNVAERQGGFADHEISIINSIRQRGITRSRVAHTGDDALLARNRKALQRGTMPPEVRQRLLQEPYVYGTQAMRDEAVRLGYHPSKAEIATPPRNILDYNLREDYDPQTGLIKTPAGFRDVLLGEEQALGKPVAGFEMQQTIGGAAPETLFQRVERRLAQSRAVIRHRDTAQTLQQHLGLGPEMANSMAAQTKVGGFPPLKAYSRAQVDALLATGVPHMRNVGIMGYNAMGELGMGRAMQFFMTGVPKHLSERLEEGGGAAHFGVRTPGKFSPSRLVPSGVRKVTTGALDRFDQAVRAARLERLDRESKGLSEFEKMDRVNQDIGAYNLQPQYVKVLQSIGANFPQWHNYVVPTSVARATLRAPGRVERLSRGVQLANDTFAPNSPNRMTLGGPNDEAASAMADIARVISGKGATGRYPTYFGGPSSIGPLSQILHPSGQSIGTRVAQAAAGVIPFGNILLDVLDNPFHSPLKPAGRALAGAAGVYSQKRPPGSMARTRQTAVTTSRGDPWAGVP